ncbi:hypothetical protein [Mesorhizobium sp. M0959]|uniref:hypothetical protein n=1 Tax=unclassified Mesorhizobium TaxID=325217 RepID=UPI00333D025C
MNSDATPDLTEPRYTTPEVLAVTRLRPEVLQTWINRSGSSEINTPLRKVFGARNPGRGNRRLYSAIDVVKLAIMRRMADLEVALSQSVEMAEAAGKILLRGEALDWNTYILLRPSGATASLIEINNVGDTLGRFSPLRGDPRSIRLDKIVENFEGLPGIGSRRDKTPLAAGGSDDRPINPEKREALARRGIHAEPVIVFPLGEIVNGALAQLSEFERKEIR